MITGCALCGSSDHSRSKCPWDKETKMKTIISGPVQQHHLDDADLFSGITPTSYITNGGSTPPVSNLPVDVEPPCPKLPDDLGEHQRNWAMCNKADALVLVGENPHLLKAAQTYKLKIYEAD